MNKIKSCAGCAGLMKITGNGDPCVYCDGSFPVEKIQNRVYDKKLQMDIDIRPINNCKKRNLLSYALMCINKKNEQK